MRILCLAPILPDGVYPASVTPFDEFGAIDNASVLRLLASFEAAGCAGVVLAGTNGEGPSLSSFEKRDLLRVANRGRGRLKLILGIATPSLSEACWLCSQAGKDGADAVLLMPPGYFRGAEEAGIRAWFRQVLDSSPVPILLYNYPKLSGFALSADLLQCFCDHQNFVGAKDSSGEAANLKTYRAAVGTGKSLFVGDETLLIEAMRAGWNGSISGSANVIPAWLAKMVSQWASGHTDQVQVAFQLCLPVIEMLRKSSQPAMNKAVLASLGVISSSAPRLPLTSTDPSEVLRTLQGTLGIRAGELGLVQPGPVLR